MMMEPLKELIIIIQDVGEGNPRAFGSQFIEKLYQVVEAMANLSNIHNVFEFKDILCFQNYFQNGSELLHMIRKR